MIAADRYAVATRGEDLGLGADEPSTRRFTRPADRVEFDADGHVNSNSGTRDLGGPGAAASTELSARGTVVIKSTLSEFERGRESALALLGRIARDDSIQSHAVMARSLLALLDGEADAADFELEFVAGWRLALLDTVADAAAYAFDLYRDEQPTDRTSDTYKVLRDSAFRAKDEADVAAHAVGRPLVDEVVGAVVPATVGELLELADMIADVDAGHLDVMTVVTR